MPDKLTDVPENNVGKITDNEIVKALGKILFNRKCAIAMSGEQFITLGDVIDLINRLQAENERLKIVENGFIELQKLYRTAKAEAYKEFAEKLKDKSWDVPYETKDAHFVQVVDVGDIDNLLKEMVGENNAN